MLPPPEIEGNGRTDEEDVISVLLQEKKNLKCEVGQNGPLSSCRSTKVVLKGAGSAKMVVKKSRIPVHTAEIDDHDDDQSTYLICYLGIAGARKSTVIWTKCCLAVVYKHV